MHAIKHSREGKPSPEGLDRRRALLAGTASLGVFATSCAGAGPGSPINKETASMNRPPLEVAKAFMSLMERLDYDNALRLVHPECEYINGPLPKTRGPAGIRAMLEPFFKPTLENEFRLLREASAGPVVFLERLDRHRLATGWVELPVTGVLEVHDGLITYWSDYFDVETIRSKWPAPA
jgi:limonene-1,2-epoxide hydrolase